MCGDRLASKGYGERTASKSRVKPRKLYHRNQDGGLIFKDRVSKSRERSMVPKLQIGELI